MKKYKFKLEGLRKLREFKEEKVKIELGRINSAISDVDNKIAELKKNIEIGYESQENVATAGAQGRMIQFYPYYVEGIKRHIEALENKKYSLKRHYQFKLKELTKARGELKVMENLKEKDQKAFKKEQQKIEDEKIQDIIQIWSLSKEKGGSV